MDKRILQLIEDAKFERELYQAALRNLEDRQNQLRFNNFAYAMRELTRHMLHRLAPDDEVRRCIWYKPNGKDKKDNTITRVERAVYATQGGLSNFYMRKKLGLNFQESHERLRNAINALSKFTHVEPEVFGLSDKDIDELVNETTEAVAGLTIAIQECRKAVAERLAGAIADAAVQQVLQETLPSVDEMATHHYVEEIIVELHEVSGITCDTIHLRASGTIGVTLQWGSNSDLRNGDGLEMDESFGFTCKLTCQATPPDPDTLVYVKNSVQVDAADWYAGADE